ncbi:MAG: sodium:proton antiporter, partial [Phycisphaerales bacterium]|nr:sodium:proton antiporter [Phycisphaerales bacterium]
LPFTVALVVCGLVIALLGKTPDAQISHDLVVLLCLPPLLFNAGLHTQLHFLRRAWLPILILAVPGVVITAGVVALSVRWLLPDATWGIALLLGVVLAPTDPISVMASFKSAGVPEKLKTVVEGEALFNDGTAVALFTVLKAALATGVAAGTFELDAAEIGLEFLRMTSIGTVLGLGLGLLTFWVLRALEDHVLETVITVALCWGSFLLAEHLHASGVIAVVVSALIMGNYGKHLSMSDETRTTLVSFWDTIDFLINSILFLLIGIELNSDPDIGGVGRLTDGPVLMSAAAIFAALLVSRALLVYPLVRATKPYWPNGWSHVIWWGGLRGSLSLALVLGLPDEALRQHLAPVVFLVVLASLLGQASTMSALIRRVDTSEIGGSRHPEPH